MQRKYELILFVATAVAIALVPLLILIYQRFLTRRRLKDLYTNLWTEKAIEQYRRLFGSTDSHDPNDKSAMEKAIQEEFFRVHGLGRYVVPLVLLVTVSAAVVIAIAFWALSMLRHETSAVGMPVVMSLAGAYIWTLYEILTRIRSQDLAPVDLSEMTLRLLAAIPIGYAFSLLALDGKEGLFAFIAAAFPLREIRLLLRRRAMKKLEMESRSNESRTLEGHLGKVLNGLSDETLARLEELGIITYMDLAYTNPVRLMACTGYSLRHILAWIDQSLLAVYAPSHKAVMSELGLQCSLDALEFYENHCWDRVKARARTWASDDAAVALASGLKIALPLLVEILREVSVDPHVQFLSTIWYSQISDTASIERQSHQQVPPTRLPAGAAGAPPPRLGIR